MRLHNTPGLPPAVLEGIYQQKRPYAGTSNEKRHAACMDSPLQRIWFGWGEAVHEAGRSTELRIELVPEEWGGAEAGCEPQEGKKAAGR
jgi:hypothetical protein